MCLSVCVVCVFRVFLVISKKKRHTRYCCSVCGAKCIGKCCRGQHNLRASLTKLKEKRQKFINKNIFLTPKSLRKKHQSQSYASKVAFLAKMRWQRKNLLKKRKVQSPRFSNLPLLPQIHCTSYFFVSNFVLQKRQKKNSIFKIFFIV